MDQVDNVLWQLKNQPQSRRIMTNIYNFADLVGDESGALRLQHDL